MREGERQVRELETQIAGLAQVEAELRRQQQRLAQLSSRIELLETQDASLAVRPVRRAWVRSPRPWRGRPLRPEAHASAWRRSTPSCKAIGYDAAAHDAARQASWAGCAWQTMSIAHVRKGPGCPGSAGARNRAV